MGGYFPENESFDPYKIHYNDCPRFEKFINNIDKTISSVFSNAMYRCYTIESHKYDLINKNYIHNFNESMYGDQIRKYIIDDKHSGFDIIYNLLSNIGGIRLRPSKWYKKDMNLLIDTIEYTDCNDFGEYIERYIRPYYYQSIILSLNLYINLYNHIISGLVSSLKANDDDIEDVKIYKINSSMSHKCYICDIDVFNRKDICASIQFIELSNDIQNNKIVKILMQKFDTVIENQKKVSYFKEQYPLDTLSILIDEVLIHKDRKYSDNITFRYYFDVLSHCIYEINYKDGATKIYYLHKYSTNTHQHSLIFKNQINALERSLLSYKRNTFTFQHDLTLQVTEITSSDYSTFSSLLDDISESYFSIYRLQGMYLLCDILTYTPPLPTNLDKYDAILDQSPTETLAIFPQHHLYYYIKDNDSYYDSSIITYLYIVTMIRYLKACGFYKKDHIIDFEKKINHVLLPIIESKLAKDYYQLDDSNIKIKTRLKVVFDSNWISSMCIPCSNLTQSTIVNHIESYIHQKLPINDTLRDIKFNNYSEAFDNICLFICAKEYSKLYFATDDNNNNIHQIHDKNFQLKDTLIHRIYLHPKDYYIDGCAIPFTSKFTCQNGMMTNSFISNINIPIQIQLFIYVKDNTVDVKNDLYANYHDSIDTALSIGANNKILNKIDAIFWKYVDRNKIDKYLYDCVTSANKMVSVTEAIMKDIFGSITNTNINFQQLITEMQYYLDSNTNVIRKRMYRLNKQFYQNQILPIISSE